MKSLRTRNSAWALWQIPVVALALLGALLLGVRVGSADAGDDSVKVTGVVASAPSPGPTGVWTITGEDSLLYTVTVDSETELPDGAPPVGAVVEVEGAPTGARTITATRMKLDDDDGEDNEEEFQGFVMERPPAADGIGTWLVQSELNVTRTVIADALTRFDKGVPAVGDWVEVKGTLQQNGEILALRIHPDEEEDGELLVRLAPGAVSSTVASRYNLTVKSALLQAAAIFLFATANDDDASLVEQTVAQMQSDPDVIWAEPNFVQRVPEDDGYKTWGWGGVDPNGYQNQHAFEQVNLQGAAAEYSGAGVTVAVLDTGVALTHTALMTRLLPGLDVIDGDALPNDEGAGLAWGHGTHVAGIVAHIAPASKILPVRVLDTNGRGNTFLLAYAIEWAVEHGAEVMNLSLGTDQDSRVLRDVIERATALGVVVVAAAGNQNQSAARYPAAYDFGGVLAVTAVDAGNAKAAFANFGTWVDLAAPGVGITSTVIGPLGVGFASWSGTSMAAPFVSGAAALAREAEPNESAGEIADRLEAHAGALAVGLGGLLDVSGALLDDGTPALTPRLYVPWSSR